MSIMGNVAGLGAVQPDWAQSDGQFADFIRNKPDIPAIEQNVERLRQLAEGALPKEGGTMTGTLSLGGNALKGLSAPKEADDAATKSYVDSAAVCTVFVQAALAADGWTGSGPYTQRVSCEGITGEDRPHWGIVYSGTAENKLAQREAFSLVDELDTEENSLVFTCFAEKPGVDLTVQLELLRTGTAGKEEAVLTLEAGAESAVQLVVEGVSYGVTNASVNGQPPGMEYDFTVL